MRLDLCQHGLEDALELVDSFTRERGVSEDLGLRLRLVFEELASNVFVHSKRAGATFLKVCLDYRDGKVAIKMAYDGPPFDPTNFRDKRMDQPLEKREGGGWGLFLVKQFAQNLKYERKGEVNNLIVEI